jgi:hypothetical protein
VATRTVSVASRPRTRSIPPSAIQRHEPLNGDGPGLTSSLAICALWVVVAAATWATNARTPPRLLFAVSSAEIRAGAGRVLVLLGWPVALAAVALVAIALERLLARPSTRRFRRAVVALSVLAVALCATIALPGVIDPDHLDAKPVNAAAAVGVAVALGLTLLALGRTGLGHDPSFTRADLFWVLPFLVLLFGALPWVLANLGLYVGDVPGLHEIFMSKQIVPEAGHRHLAAVHLGNHDGLDGLLLSLCAVVLMRSLDQMRRLRTATRTYLALLFVYGLAVATSDWWYEQLVKRGTLNVRIPSSMFPSLSLQWAGIVAAATLVYLLERRITRACSRAGRQ